MVTIGMNYQVLEGKEQVFEKAFERVREAMTQMEGHDESRLYQQVAAKSPEYLIVTRWSSEEAFKRFIASDQFKKVTDWGAAQILRGPPRHTTYRES